MVNGLDRAAKRGFYVVSACGGFNMRRVSVKAKRCETKWAISVLLRVWWVVYGDIATARAAVMQ